MDDRPLRFCAPFNEGYYLGMMLSVKSVLINVVLTTERLLYPCWNDRTCEPVVCKLST